MGAETAEYCDDRVCLSVCLSASIGLSLTLHIRSSPNFYASYVPVAMAWSSAGSVAICNVFPVL